MIQAKSNYKEIILWRHTLNWGVSTFLRTMERRVLATLEPMANTAARDVSSERIELRLNWPSVDAYATP